MKKQNLVQGIISIGLWLMAGCLFAQNTVGKSDDMGRVTLAAYVAPQIAQMPDAARSMLTNKLNLIASQNGLGGSARNERFIITANINVLTKDIIAGPPMMNALTLDITLYIGDGVAGTKFASKSVTVKGVGTNETKAYIEGIKMIKPSDPAIQAFVEEGKKKIIEYYNTKCDFIIKTAETAASMKNYEEALYQLTTVPDVCKECYDKCMTAAGPMYKKYMDNQCKVKLADAKTQWASTQNADGAAAVAAILGTIDPDAACYKEAMALSQEVGKKIKELDKRDWDFKMKVHNDAVSIEKAAIGAYRDVGVAYGNGQPNSVTYNVSGWW